MRASMAVTARLLSSLLATAAGLGVFASAQTADAQSDWRVDITVSEVGGADTTLTFGVHPDATDGVDDGSGGTVDLGERQGPPWPPAGNFWAQFTAAGGQGLDLRAGAQPQSQHELTLQLQRAAGGAITLTWNPYKIAQATTSAVLEDPWGGTSVEMRTTGSVTVASPTNSVNIIFTSVDDFPGFVDVDISQLILGSAPTSSISGSILTPPLEVSAQDSAGRFVPGVPITVWLATGAGTLRGSLTRATIGDTAQAAATFDDLVYHATTNGETFSLRATGQDFEGNPLSVSTPDITSEIVAASAWRADITVTEVGGADTTLTFGVHPDATDGVDNGSGGTVDLGERQGPPWPPAGNFWAQFTAAGGLGLDLRSGAQPQSQHELTLQFQRAAGGTITLTWNKGRIAQATTSAVLEDQFGGGILFPSVDMRTAGSVTLGSAGIAAVRITFTSVDDFPGFVDVAQLVVDSAPTSSISGSILTPPLEVSAYDSTGRSPPGVAIAVSLASGAGTLTGTLTRVTNGDTTHAAAIFDDLVYHAMGDGEVFSLRASALDLEGNSIGVSTPDVTSEIVAASAWRADITVTEVGGADTTLTFGVHPDATDGVDDGSGGTVDLGEQQEPPLPPSGHFDARFATGGGMLVDLRAGAQPQSQHGLTLQFQRAAGGAITLTWNSGRIAQATTSAVLEDPFGGVFVPSVDMRTAGSVTVSNVAISSVRIIFTSVDDFPGFVDVAQLVVDSAPTSSISGSILTPPLEVSAYDSTGRSSPSVPITISLASGAGTLTGTLTRVTTGDTTSAAAIFDDLVYHATSHGEVFSLRASALDLEGNAIDVSTAEITSEILALAFATEPAGSVSGHPFTTQPVVHATRGGVDPTYNGAVTITLASGTGTLSGTTTVVAQNGVATLTDLAYTAASDGEAFSLQASDDGTIFSPATSTVVTSDVVATGLAFLTQPAGSVSGHTLSTQPVVAAQDADGTKDVDFSEVVDIALASGAGILSATPVAAIAGTATYLDVVYTAVADREAFTLQADGGGFTVESSAVVADVVATQLVLVQQPAETSPDLLMSPPFVVEARDADGLLDLDYAQPVYLEKVTGHGLLLGSTSAVPAAGVATLGAAIYFSPIVPEVITLRALAGGMEVATAPIEVHLNRPPVLEPIGDQTVVLGDTLTLVLVASDPDGDGLVLSVSGNRAGSTLTGDVFMWPPAAGLPSIDVVTFTVTDSRGASDSETITIAEPPLFQVPLTAGWNLVALAEPTLGDSIHTITAPLGANLERVLGFETASINPNPPVAGAKLYDPSLPDFVNTLQLIDPRLGYWVKVSADDTLISAAPLAKRVAFAEAPLAEDGGLHPVYDFMGIHGSISIDGQSAPEGTLVEVADSEGNMAGRCDVRHAGYYGFLPVYRDSPDTQIDEGAQTSEWLSIFVNGRDSGNKMQWTEFGDVVRLDLDLASLPLSIALRQNYPNPFNPETTIRFDVPEPADVELAVYNLAGQKLATLAQGRHAAGTYAVRWGGRDDLGRQLASGVYPYRLTVGQRVDARTLVLLK